MTNKSIYWEQEKIKVIKRHKKKAIGQMLIRTLFAGIISALLMCAAMIIFIDAFEPWGEAIDKYYCVWYLAAAVLIMNLWNEWIFLWRKRIIGVVGNLVILFIFLYIPVPDLLGNHFVEGLDALTELYVRWWNYHFGTTIHVSPGNAAYQMLGAECLLLMFGVIFQWLSAFSRKKSVMLALPMGVLCMELLVGLTPGWLALSFMFVGGMLALYVDFNRELCVKRALLLTLVAVLTVFLSGKLFGKAADSVYTLNGDWLEFQQGLENTIKNIDLKSLLSSGDVVNNQAPSYKNEEVIRLMVNEMPQDNIYLRGYHCGDYVNGAWKKDEKSFQKSCRKQGISEEEGAKKLLQLRYNAASGSSNSRIQYQLTYTGMNSEYCYLPYAVALEGDIKDYSFSGDYLVEKSKSEEQYQVFGWKQTDYAMVLRGSYGTLSEEDNVFFDWYNEFVRDNYLDVPANQESVKKLVKNMKTELQCRECVDMLDADLHGMETINAARWLLANMVADKLKNMATYSLELNKLPAGEDAVEYFLSKGQKGFCVHFASAGVLMLRELGVPARYVSGYFVSKDRLQSTNGAFSASVLDSYAHAWVEIYLDNYGWVPVEVTSGYRDRGTENFGGTEGISDVREEEQGTEEPPKEQDETDEGEDDGTGGEQLQDTVNENSGEIIEGDINAPQKDRQGTDSQAVSGTAYGNAGALSAERNKMWIILLDCGGVLLVLLLIYAGYGYVNKQGKRKEKQLAGYIRYGYTQKAVMMINRRLYRMLVQKKRRSLRKLSDAEYLAALKEAFPEIEGKEWEKYFEVFRRAAYSQENISQEEAGECYKMYEAIVKKKDSKVREMR